MKKIMIVALVVASFSACATVPKMKCIKGTTVHVMKNNRMYVQKFDVEYVCDTDDQTYRQVYGGGQMAAQPR